MKVHYCNKSRDTFIFMMGVRKKHKHTRRCCSIKFYCYIVYLNNVWSLISSPCLCAIQCEKVHTDGRPPLLWQKPAISQETRRLPSFIYKWAQGCSGWSASPASVSSAPQSSDSMQRPSILAPSLLKCTINQYSNKSSFMLEKCTFQLSGLGVLVASPVRPESAWPRRWP